MAQPISLSKVFPIYKVEHDCILSKQGDVTLAYEATLPEIFTLSDQEYEAFHQILLKAIKVLPNYSVFHKQDWFVAQRYKAEFEDKEDSFLSRSSERFFNERPYLDHRCYIMLTRKPANRKPSSSVFSNLIRRSLVPEETLNPQRMQEFLDSAGQFERILQDSGFIKLRRIKDDELVGNQKQPKDDVMFYRFKIRNQSNINYDIDFLKFYIRDKSRMKRMASQEIEVKPIYIFGNDKVVKGKSETEIIYALEKFTIPESKHLDVEMFEHNGGRHFDMVLKNKTIVDAKLLQ